MKRLSTEVRAVVLRERIWDLCGSPPRLTRGLMTAARYRLTVRRLLRTTLKLTRPMSAITRQSEISQGEFGLVAKAIL